MRTEEIEVMTCVSCGVTKAWRDGFPTTIYAECWSCSFAKHLRESHPGQIRRARRKAMREARTRLKNEVIAEADKTMARQGYGKA